MGLTKERLAEFVGGDLEIRDYEGKALGGRAYVVRGPIESATVDFNGLAVRLGWLARNDGCCARHIKDTWIISGYPPECKASLDTFTEQKDLADPGHIRLNSPIRGVVLIFHPPGDNLKPSQVAGHPGAPPT
jgi:hypothetical protein